MDLQLETRVRLNASQTAKGAIQLDITTEASTVEQARELFGQAIDALTKEVESRGFALTSKSGPTAA